jgi:hypothetical protein
MPNSFYNPSGNPATGSQGLSSLVRGEFINISAAFDLLPTIAGNGGKVVVINPGGTAMTVTAGTLALAGNLSTTGAFNTVFAQGASVTLTLPVINGTLATTANVATETTRALAAEGTNATAIITETTNRTAADAAEVTARNTAIGVETTARTAADAAEVTARNTAIGVETTRALAAEGTNATAISTETTNRTAADAAEVTARNTAIGVETTNRTAADAAEVTARNTAIGVETTARIAAAAGAIFGLRLSNDGGAPNTVLDVAAGTCTDSTNAVTITLGAFTKSIAGSWVAGTGNNGMGVGLTATLSTWYHVFAIIVSGVADVYFDTSVTAANKPASTTAFRRIGSFKLDASVHILAFSQNGDEFLWSSPPADLAAGNLGTTAFTLSLSVPPGVKVNAFVMGNILNAATTAGLLINAIDQAAIAGGALVANYTAINPAPGAPASWGQMNVRTDISGAIRLVANAANTQTTVYTVGWIDARGRLG